MLSVASFKGKIIIIIIKDILYIISENEEFFFNGMWGKSVSGQVLSEKLSPMVETTGFTYKTLKCKQKFV